MHGKLSAPAPPAKLALLAAVLLACAGARAQEDGLTPFFEGRVTRVVDGDTIVVQNQTTGQPVRVQLRGTDAPELRQPGGGESRRRLETLVAGAQVRVEFKFADKYGQVLGLVLKDGDDINYAQLAEGMAWHRTNLVNELGAEERKAYERAEAEARAARRGLWQGQTPLAPWEYRRENSVSEDPRDDPAAAAAPAAAQAVRADRRARTFFTPGCPGYERVPARQRVRFRSSAEAARAGYKPAPGCEAQR